MSAVPATECVLAQCLHVNTSLTMDGSDCEFPANVSILYSLSMRLSSTCRGSIATLLLVVAQIHTEARLLHELHHQHKKHHHENSVPLIDHGSNLMVKPHISTKSDGVYLFQSVNA